MSIIRKQGMAALLLLTAAVAADAQTVPPPVGIPSHTVFSQNSRADLRTPVADPGTSGPVQLLQEFKPADVKFNLPTLMQILKDHRHEGWVLAAYADPKTQLPLIGAGFSLDLPERNHPQRDLLNPHPFLEPSTLELWQAAGLDPQNLQKILVEFDQRPVAHATRRHHRRMRPVAAQITDQEANDLLRIAVVEAIYNAKAYCRGFDSLTASQQMALTQLVYQMGVNLEQFQDFLKQINDPSAFAQLALGPVYETAHWQAAQDALIDSQWARLYRTRAISVISMLDPHYLDDPGSAELHIAAALPLPVAQTRSSRRTVDYRTAAYKRKPAGRQGRKAASRGKKTV